MGPRAAPALSTAAAAVVDLAALSSSTEAAVAPAAACLELPAASLGSQPDVSSQPAAVAPSRSLLNSSSAQPAGTPGLPSAPAASMVSRPAVRGSRAAIEMVSADASRTGRAAVGIGQSAYPNPTGGLLSAPDLLSAGELAVTGGQGPDPLPPAAAPEWVQPHRLSSRQSSVNSTLLRDALGGSLTIVEGEGDSVLGDRSPISAAGSSAAAMSGGPNNGRGLVSAQQTLRKVCSAREAAAGHSNGQPRRINSATFSAMAGLAPPISITDYVRSLASKDAARQA